VKRREFIAGLGSAAAWPLAARAQQPAMPVIGYLSSQSADDDYKNFTVPFLQGLKDNGYVDGQNVTIEYRWAENQYDRLPALAADLVRRRVAVISAEGALAARAAKAATKTIPIVFSTGGDPVALGLVASLNRPGANLTGSAFLDAELGPKKLQLLHEVVPNAAAFGILVDPALPAASSSIADLQAAARTLGVHLVIVSARTDNDLEPAFASFSQHRVGAVRYVLALNVAGFLQAPEKWNGEVLVVIISGLGAEIPDHRQCLLRPRRQRPRRRAPKTSDERAPLHWITSSAVADSVSGMVRPSALAVCMLMTNSNLVDCTTGRSAGLVPLRILPV
jgi:ABC transporter substrate binding protein